MGRASLARVSARRAPSEIWTERGPSCVRRSEGPPWKERRYGVANETVTWYRASAAAACSLARK